MLTQTLEVTSETHAKLRSLADREDEPTSAILERAIEAYRRQKFLDGLAADFARLREKPAEWASEEAERSEWDATLADGLSE